MKVRRVRRRRGRLRKSKKPVCIICGQDSFAHKSHSYYGRIEHTYRIR